MESLISFPLDDWNHNNQGFYSLAKYVEHQDLPFKVEIKKKLKSKTEESKIEHWNPIEIENSEKYFKF